MNEKTGAAATIYPRSIDKKDPNTIILIRKDETRLFIKLVRKQQK